MLTKIAAQNMLKFWLNQRQKIKLYNGDVPNKEVAFLIDQMDIYIDALQIALTKDAEQEDNGVLGY